MAHTKLFHNSIELPVLLPRIFKAHPLQCRATGVYNDESGKCQNKVPRGGVNKALVEHREDSIQWKVVLLREDNHSRAQNPSFYKWRA